MRHTIKSFIQPTKLIKEDKMASIQVRNKWLWISYYRNGIHFRKPLKLPDTKEGMATAKKIKAQIEYESMILKNQELFSNSINLFPTNTAQPVPVKQIEHLKLKDALQKYFDHRGDGMTEKSIFGIVMNILIDKICGNISILNVTEQHGNELKNWLLKNKKSRNTSASYLNHLRVVFNHYVAKKVIPENPIPKIKWESKPVTTIPAEDVNNVLNHLKQKDFMVMYYLIKFLYLTGFRISEAIALKKSDIDFHNDVILVHNKKAKRTEEFPIEVELELKALLKEMVKFFDKDLMFGNFNKDNTLKLFNKYLTECGLKHYKIHDLRRTASSRWALIFPAAVVQKLMRHASYSTTLKSYTRIELKQAIQQVHN
jgi:integrase